MLDKAMSNSHLEESSGTLSRHEVELRPTIALHKYRVPERKDEVPNSSLHGINIEPVQTNSRTGPHSCRCLGYYRVYDFTRKAVDQGPQGSSPETKALGDLHSLLYRRKEQQHGLFFLMNKATRNSTLGWVQSAKCLQTKFCNSTEMGSGPGTPQFTLVQEGGEFMQPEPDLGIRHKLKRQASTL
ncbi:hypothetical protein BDR05DRAFT_949978 [Suillus weaverae]|nr:hypothetical protein BDR05DRAFT_949978 [Suillus weaverae]